jgi:ABC-type dipeptide/oligopeptide/nickel transport system permease component
LTLWLSATLAFFALRVLPGDAVVAQLAASGASEETIQARQRQLGLHEPILIQYLQFITNLTHGDLGYSLVDGLPVTELVLERLGTTMPLAIGGFSVAITMGVGLGIMGAFSLRWGLSSAARSLTSLALGTPVYWTATLVIFAFGFLMNANSQAGVWLLPIAVLGFHTSGAIARIVQTSLRETMNADFVVTARAKGLPESLILYRHILRAALPPAIPVIALQAGFLLGGTVIIETLFMRPGLGQLLLNRTIQQDYPVVQGLIVLSAFIYTIANTVADFLLRLVDPRISP